MNQSYKVLFLNGSGRLEKIKTMRRGGLKKAQLFLSILYILISFSLCANGAESGRLYPLTLPEMQKVFSRWLEQSGYQLSRTTLPDGAVRLTGVRDNERWRIVMQSHSPLYSSFEAECLSDGRPNAQRVRELFVFADDYVAKNIQQAKAKNAEIPPALLHTSFVVCIHALSGNTPIQFSGFVVDPGGIIVSTAHDLDMVKDVSVTTSDGRKLSGRLIKKDLHHDLAVIRVDSRFSSYANLRQGRNVLRHSEPIYAVTCLDGEKRILSGLVAGPVKMQEDILMWQLEMDTPRGSSGSPVFDRDGKIVAVVKGRYRGNPFIGFMIPVEAVVKFLSEEQ